MEEVVKTQLIILKCYAYKVIKSLSNLDFVIVCFFASGESFYIWAFVFCMSLYISDDECLTDDRWLDWQLP